MTHKPEKSDSVVVAVKPTNKAERSAAEPVEPRTATKGNAGQQSTRRAQDRVSVSQALERVRQAARQRKKERFTALLHHVDPAMLRTAFYAMKRDAAPGVDGVTWETYEQNLDRRIEILHARVQAGTYRALPSRRSYIPKEDGSKRPLAVAAIEDKIVQRAVAAVLSTRPAAVSRLSASRTGVRLDSEALTIGDTKGDKHVVPSANIEEVRTSPISTMPDAANTAITRVSSSVNLRLGSRCPARPPRSRCRHIR